MRDLDPVRIGEAWLSAFAEAVTARDPSRLEQLIEEGSHWRDVVALTWDFRRRSGAEAVSGLIAGAEASGMRELRLSERFPAPRTAHRAGRDIVEVFFDFTVDAGQGTGVARLVPQGDRWLAWIVFTSLQSLRSEVRPPAGPEVVIVGAGHSGLALGAWLKHLGTEAILLERSPRVGDNWRTRYDSLTLHTPVVANHLPFLHFPDDFPLWIAKDQFADWLESYATAMELDVRTNAEVLGAEFSEDANRWLVRTLGPGGAVTELRPRHLVLATGGGFGSFPSIPALPGLDAFAGEVTHTKHYRNGRAYRGKRALVVGVSTSGHDAALDLSRHGAEVTMLQRSPITVVSPEMANLTVAQYFQGLPIEEADFIGASGFIEPVLTKVLQSVTKIAAEHDRELIEAVERRGLRTDQSSDGTGWLLKSLRTGGGYYPDVGASAAIAAGDIRILDATRLRRFDDGGAVLDDGTRLPLDLVVLATGYEEPRQDLRAVLGEELADRIKTVFRLDPEGEHANTWRPTAQRGLWIMGGGIPTARNYSRYLALQLTAAVRGLHPAYVRHDVREA